MSETAAIVLGVARLGRFRARGLAAFPATRQAFLNSLAPWIAIPLVLSLLLAVRGEAARVPGELLSACVGLLAPQVLSHWLARQWGREPAWLRYATAFNWCQWAVPAAACVVVLTASLAMAGGLPVEVAAMASVVGVAGYALGLHWFLAWRGLGMSSVRAVLFVVFVNLGTGLLWAGPTLLDRLANGDA